MIRDSIEGVKTPWTQDTLDPKTKTLRHRSRTVRSYWH